jgi:hypothetical protein
MGIETIAAASVLSAIGSGVSAYQASEQTKAQKKEMKRARTEQENELQAQENKQNGVNKRYGGMQTNLYNGGVGGIDSGNLINTGNKVQ